MYERSSEGFFITLCQQLEQEFPLTTSTSKHLAMGKSWAYGYHFCSLPFADSQVETAVIRM